jgi:hypothetical protein
MQLIYNISVKCIRKLRILHILRAIYINLVVLFLTEYWKIKKNNKHHDIHCYGKTYFNNKNEDWCEALSRIVNKPISNYCSKDIANETIVENIVTHCSDIKPKVIFVLFEEIDVIECFSEICEVNNIHYNNYIDDNTDNFASSRYRLFYNDINLFLNFINHLEYINLFCDNNNIKLFWYIKSKYIKKLNSEHYSSLMHNKTLHTYDKLKFIAQENFNNVLAKEFANLFYNTQ